MSVEDFIRDVASHPIGQTPLTLQDVANRRVALDSYAATSVVDDLFTPRIVWRLAWLSVRQVQLVPPLLPDHEIVSACRSYVDRLIDFAGTLNRSLPSDAPQPEILHQYFAESTAFWRSIAKGLEDLRIEPLHWTEQDASTLMWIRLSTFYCAGSVTRHGRTRSRRELAAMLARTLEGIENPNTIRLRTIPKLEKHMQAADRWARLCATRPPAQT